MEASIEKGFGMMQMLAFFNNLFTPTGLIILAIAMLLVFGGRLPEVAKNLGKSIVEFKKGLNSSGKDDDDYDRDGNAREGGAKRMEEPKVTASTPKKKSLPSTKKQEETEEV